MSARVVCSSSGEQNYFINVDLVLQLTLPLVADILSGYGGKRCLKVRGHGEKTSDAVDVEKEAGSESIKGWNFECGTFVAEWRFYWRAASYSKAVGSAETVLAISPLCNVPLLVVGCACSQRFFYAVCFVDLHFSCSPERSEAVMIRQAVGFTFSPRNIHLQAFLS